MTAPQQPKIAPERLEQHFLWLKSKGFRGKRLVLENNLHGVELKGADLRRVLIQGDLRGARLSGAKLNKADLNQAVLWDADLSGADLTDATGLLPSAERGGISPLSGADLRGAKLPEDVAKFPALDNVAELSKNAGALFLSLVSGDAFIQLIVAKATALQLLTNSGSTTIPFVNAEISTMTLFWLAPLLLLINFIALHLYLQRLWELMSNLPAVFPDGLLLTQKSYPWLPNGLVRKGFPKLEKRAQALAMFQKWLFTFLIYALVPLSLFPICATYLKVHSWRMTEWHILCGALFLWSAWAFYAIATATLARDERSLDKWRCRISRGTLRDKTTVMLPPLVASSSFAAFSCLLCLAAITGVSSDPSLGKPQLSTVAPRRWVPLGLAEIGYSPFADLNGMDVSQKPDKWEDKPSDDVDSVHNGAKLRGQNLQYADLEGAFVVHGKLSDASLNYAYLDKADLRASDCKNADFDQAFLEGADLRGAHMEEAYLEGAHLGGADLRGAYLEGAHFGGAHLEGAHLKGARLEGADLRGAYLEGAHLGGAYLEYADLRGVHLKGVYLEYADLEGARLEGARLEGAHLRGAKLGGATYSQQTFFPSVYFPAQHDMRLTLPF